MTQKEITSIEQIVAEAVAKKDSKSLLGLSFVLLRHKMQIKETLDYITDACSYIDGKEYVTFREQRRSLIADS